MRTAPTARSSPALLAGTVITSSGPQMKEEPQSVVGSFRSRAAVRAASFLGRSRLGAQPGAPATWTSPGVWKAYASAISWSASHEVESPLASSRAMVSASRTTESSVSPRSWEVSEKATGTVNRAMAIATRKM